MIREIDPGSHEIAARIVEIQRAAYAVEAALIGFDGIPQLTETVDDVRSLQDICWRGCFEGGGMLVGLIAWARLDGITDIDRLAVDPAHSRRGYGRRLVRAVPTDHTTIVSTGAENGPAIALYLDEGFGQIGQTQIAPGVFTTKFSRAAR